ELGFLDSEDELVGMADLYLTYGNPHRAARILEREMQAGSVSRTERNLEKLGNMYFLAREYEEALTYLTEAARLSSSGKLDYRIGFVYFGEEKWEDAERHFRRALKKGRFERQCAARLLLAHSLVALDKEGNAVLHFERVAHSKKCSPDRKREARGWAEYLSLGAWHWNPENRDFVRKVIRKLKRAMLAAYEDDERILALSREALKAAKAARAAAAGEARQRRLAEYERARHAAGRLLSAEVLENARTDRAEAARIAANAEKRNLTRLEARLIGRLVGVANRRAEILEKARAALDEAEQIAAQARAGSPPPAAAAR
ncbi:MAG: tetratricopeptide repeat protein, partial [Alphaproteobacteria bacterium]